MVAAMTLIPLGDAFAKLASGVTTYSPAAIAWARFALGAALVLPIALFAGVMTGLDTRFWTAQVIRGALIASTIVCIITAVSMVPLPDAFGAFFIGPAIATVLAHLVLRELVRGIEWAALAFGFVGVMLIVRPGWGMAEGQLWAISAGLVYGGYLTATRWAAPVGPPLAQLAGQLCVGAVLLLPMAIGELDFAYPQAPGYLFGSGVSSALGNLFAIMAFGMARASLVTPLVYWQLVSATVLGISIFGDVPDALTSAGLAIVIAAGLSPVAASRRSARG